MALDSGNSRKYAVLAVLNVLAAYSPVLGVLLGMQRGPLPARHFAALFSWLATRSEMEKCSGLPLPPSDRLPVSKST